MPVLLRDLHAAFRYPNLHNLSYNRLHAAVSLRPTSSSSLTCTAVTGSVATKSRTDSLENIPPWMNVVLFQVPPEKAADAAHLRRNATLQVSQAVPSISTVGPRKALWRISGCVLQENICLVCPTRRHILMLPACNYGEGVQIARNVQHKSQALVPQTSSVLRFFQLKIIRIR